MPGRNISPMVLILDTIPDSQASNSVKIRDFVKTQAAVRGIEQRDASVCIGVLMADLDADRRRHMEETAENMRRGCKRGLGHVAVLAVGVIFLAAPGERCETATPCPVLTMYDAAPYSHGASDHDFQWNS
eukprot:1566075-Rhodomonas_salina.1